MKKCLATPQEVIRYLLFTAKYKGQTGTCTFDEELRNSRFDSIVYSEGF